MTPTTSTSRKPWKRGATRVTSALFRLRAPEVSKWPGSVTFGIPRVLFPLPSPEVVKLPSVTPFRVPSVSHATIPILAEPEISTDLACQAPSTVELGVHLPPVSHVTLPLLEEPKITTDLTCHPPSTLEFGVHLPPLVLEDLTSWLPSGLITGPDVVQMFEPLRFPAAIGKSYLERARDDDLEATPPLSVLPSEEDLTEECVHGLPRASCAICLGEADKSTRRRAQTTRQKEVVVDPLDLILPLLQPPLGEDFDNIVSFPPGKGLLRFQPDGVRFLLDRTSALLGDEMGLGKSIQAITALRLLSRTGRARSVLLLCPKSVVSDWYNKLWEWAPELRVVRVRAPKQQRAVLWESPGHIYLTTYETLREDLDIVNTQGFDLCLLDEIQRIKNPGTGVTQAARHIDAKIRWGLSGTPLENKLEELISIFAYLKPGLLQVADADRPSLVKKLIKPYFLRRRVADVLDDLPQKVSHEVWLDLTDRQRTSYERALREGRTSLNQNRTVLHVLALITKLKQICNLDPETGESAKLEYLQEQLEELREGGEKALVFSQYPKVTLEQIAPQLEEFKPQLYHGQLSDKQRDDLVREFQEQDTSNVLLMSVRAGGLGITLTRANHVFHFDLWWNPAVAQQAEGRAYRIGQEKTVFVKTLYTVDTIEQRIHDLLAEKRALFQEVIDGLSDDDLTRLLTEEELFGLFDLEPARPTGKPSLSQKATEVLRSVSPVEFEELVASLYERMGFAVRRTQLSYDEGVDLYAQRFTDAGVEGLIIQCKHYFGGTVGVAAVRELYGTLRSKPNMSRAVLVTSGRFSQRCGEFARGKNIDLMPVDQLLGLLLKYDLLGVAGG
jgi:hypothetical protein